MSKMLFNKPPLVIDKDLTQIVGLHEAIILQQIHYWIEINTKANRNFQDGYYWTFNSYREWQKQFPFWSERTIQRLILSLESKGFVITGNFNKLNLDKTKWYRIDYDKVSSSTTTECRNHDDSLTQPIPETTPETTPENNNNSSSPLCFKLYEDNIGLLTPIISDELKLILKEVSDSWTCDAIMEATKANIRNLRYITGILRRWQIDGRETKQVSKRKPAYARKSFDKGLPKKIWRCPGCNYTLERNRTTQYMEACPMCEKKGVETIMEKTEL